MKAVVSFYTTAGNLPIAWLPLDLHFSVLMDIVYSFNKKRMG